MCDESFAEPFTQSLNQRMLYLYEKAVLTDVVFEVGSEAQPVAAHKAVLASGSPVFHAMFCGGLAEKAGNTIRVPDITLEGFQVLLNFIYSGNYIFQEACLAAMTLVAAKKYLVNPLVCLCRAHLEANLSTENVLYVLSWINEMNEDELVDRCLRTVDRDFEQLATTREFLHLDSGTLATIVGRNSLISREKSIFLAVVMWAMEACDTRGLDARSGADLREVMGGVLAKIRFPLMSFRELTEEVKPSSVLNAEEILSIIQCRNMGKAHPMFESVPRCLGVPLRESEWDLVMLFNSNKLVNYTGLTWDGSLSTCELYGAIDFRVNRKVILGGLRVFASQHHGQQLKMCSPLHFTLNCLSEESSEPPLYQFELADWKRDSRRALIPTLDTFLPSEVVVYPGLWYRATLHWTHKRPAALASNPVDVRIEGDLHFEFALPSNSSPRSPGDSPPSPYKLPYCKFLNAFHYVEVGALAW